MLNKIIIKGLRLYAYHGVMELERKVGAYFTIDCEVETDNASPKPFLLNIPRHNLSASDC